MPTDFPSPQTAVPALKKAGPALAPLQTASCKYVYKRYGELVACVPSILLEMTASRRIKGRIRLPESA
jgi:hypothetical protein